MAQFKEAFDVLMKLEGGYDNDPYDAGGETKYGITAPRLKKAKSLGVAGGKTIKSLGIRDAEAIWFHTLWKPQKYVWFESQDLATKVFQLAAVMGPRQAHKELQRAINTLGTWNLKIDGRIGPQTRRAIPPKTDILELLLTAHAQGFFRLITHVPTEKQIVQYAKNKKYIKGWMNRSMK